MNLDLVPIEELVVELENRCDSVCISSLKKENDGQERIMNRYKGCISTCLGMIEQLKHRILNNET